MFLCVWCVDRARICNTRKHITKKKTGSSKLKLASKCEKKKQKTQENRKQTLRQNRRKKKQIETNTPSLVGMNVVNLGEQKFQGEERRGKQTNEEAEERKRERERRTCT